MLYRVLCVRLISVNKGDDESSGSAGMDRHKNTNTRNLKRNIMKPRLSKLLITALLAAQCGVGTYAEEKNGGVDYVYTDAANGKKNAIVTVDSDVNTIEVGAVYKTYIADQEMETTLIEDVEITMTGGTVSSILAASPHNGMPVDGKVHIDVSGGTVGTLLGGNYMNTAHAASYGANVTQADIDSITIEVGGYAKIGSIRGGNMVGTDGGWPTEDFMKQFGTTGDISISVKNNAEVGSIYGTAWDHEHVNGSISIDVEGAKVPSIYGAWDGIIEKNVSITVDAEAVNYAFASGYARVKGDAEITVNGGSVDMVSAGYDGKTDGNTRIIINDGSVSQAYALASGTAGKNTTIDINGGTTTNAYAVTGGVVKGNAMVTVSGGTVSNAFGVSNMFDMPNAKVEGDVIVTAKGGTTGGLYGMQYGYVEGGIYVTANGGTVTSTMRGLWDATVRGDVVVTTEKGEVNEVIGALGGAVGGNVIVRTKGGKVQGNCSAVIGAHVYGNAEVHITGGESQTVHCVRRGDVDGNATIVMTGGSVVDLIGVGSDIYGLGNVKGDLSVHLLGGNVTGKVWGGGDVTTAASYTLYVGSEDMILNSSVKEIKYFDRVIVAKGSSISTSESNPFLVTGHTYNVSRRNLTKAIMSTSADVAVNEKITLTLNVPTTLRSGRYKLIDASKGNVDTTNWTPDMVAVTNGTGGMAEYTRVRNADGQLAEVSFDDLKWEGNVLYLYQVKNDIKTPLASNWGAFKSSQAFVSAINGNRHNHVIIPTVTDNKSDLTSCANSGYSIAWGAAYGQNARIGGIGADYNIYGGAIGAEHHFVSNRSIGIAAGYDWGKISPFSMDSIDQETAHVALYGRAASWDMGQKGTMNIDWSAALSNTTSETDCISSDWEQKHMQLDARLSYLHELTDKAMGYVFTGVQYYAAEDATADYVNISSMQNLRTEIGAGLIYNATQRLVLRSEFSLYNDAMRHNPHVSANGIQYKGTNPGRLGGSIGVGVSYKLTDQWDMHANYSFDTADNSTENNVNVGASFQF